MPTEAEIVRWIFELYINGWGCKRIANFLTDERIPTSRMSERERKEAESKRKSIRTRFFVPMSSATGPLLRNHYCSEAAFPSMSFSIASQNSGITRLMRTMRPSRSRNVCSDRAVQTRSPFWSHIS